MAIGAYAAAIIGSKSPTHGAFFGAMLLGAIIAGLVASSVLARIHLQPSFEGDYLAVDHQLLVIRILIVNGGS